MANRIIGKCLELGMIYLQILHFSVFANSGSRDKNEIGNWTLSSLNQFVLVWIFRKWSKIDNYHCSSPHKLKLKSIPSDWEPCIIWKWLISIGFWRIISVPFWVFKIILLLKSCKNCNRYVRRLPPNSIPSSKLLDL